MKTNPTLSIIIPIYNVEEYLSSCVDSVLNQSYQNIEVILVDDGSPDNCPQICDVYAKKDARVKVVHKPNGGLSSSRNAGIKASTGEFIAFVDSDDWVATGGYARCMQLLQEHDAQAVMFDYFETNDESFVVKQSDERLNVFEDKNILQHYMEKSTRDGSYSVCGGVWERSLIADLLFREGKINEDIDFKYKALSNCRKCVWTNQVYYYYRQGNVTISSGGLKSKDFELYEAAEALCEMTDQEDYGEIKFLGQVKKARTPLSMLCKIAYFGIADKTLDKKKVVNQLTKENRRNIGILLKSPMSLSRKVLALMFAVNYYFTESIVKLAKLIVK